MSNYHIHHILPRHMGGTDDPSNLIKLTLEEHAMAHKKLWEEFGHWQDKVAWLAISGVMSHEEAVYESIRSGGRKGGLKKAGTKVPSDVREKMRNAKLGKKRAPFSDDHKKKIGESVKRTKMQKMS